MSCDHELTAEYLYPADARVAEITDEDDGLRFTVVLPCPECDEALAVETSVESVAETDLGVPLDDSDDVYD